MLAGVLGAARGDVRADIVLWNREGTGISGRMDRLYVSCSIFGDGKYQERDLGQDIAPVSKDQFLREPDRGGCGQPDPRLCRLPHVWRYRAGFEGGRHCIWVYTGQLFFDHVTGALDLPEEGGTSRGRGGRGTAG